MTPNQRLDRLERIAKLFVKAGLRERRNLRELDEKIGIMVDAQIRNEARFAKLEDKMNVLVDVQISNAERFAKSDERFARLEARTNETLNALLDITTKRNGNS